MSDTEVDKRVVQMDFDNKKFEQNVKQSTESLNDLKKSLNKEQLCRLFLIVIHGLIYQ